MAIKLLESLPSEGNDVAQQIDDGAIMNFQAAHHTNGAIHGCVITNTSSTINLGPGLLMVRGFRFKIDTVTAIKHFAVYPEEITTYYIYLVITRSGNNASFVWETSRFPRVPFTSLIEREDGSFSYKVAEVKAGPSGIIGKAKSLIGTITAAGSGTSQNIPSALPAPRLELVAASSKTETEEDENGMTRGYLVLANFDDYQKFTDVYTIKLVLLRHLQRGRSRQRNDGESLYTLRTGFVKPYEHVGWRETESTIKVSIEYVELETVVIASSETYEYKRSGVIDSIRNIIDNAFYYNDPFAEEGDETKFPVEPDSGQERGYIRATRSKRLGRSKLDTYKHNFFKFAYRAELYDSAGKLVTLSNPGSIVTITVNRSISDKLDTRGGFGQLFRIKIE